MWNSGILCQKGPLSLGIFTAVKKMNLFYLFLSSKYSEIHFLHMSCNVTGNFIEKSILLLKWIFICYYKEVNHINFLLFAWRISRAVLLCDNF